MKNPNIAIKRTGVTDIPKEWGVVLLRDTGELRYGYTCSATNKNTGTKFVRITDINEDAKPNWESIPYCEVNKKNYEKYRLNVGDILFARIGATTGKTAFVDREIRGVFASYLIRFKSAREELDTKFLYYFTQSNPYWIQVHKNKEGQLKKGLNAKVLGSIQLPFPPLPEQKNIAEILSTMDQGIEKVNETIEKTQRLKKGLMQELLTKGIGHKEFKDTEVGRIPKGWELVKLSNVFKLASGKSRPKEISEIHTQKMAVPVYGGNGILGYTNRFMIDNETIVIGRVGEYCGSIHKTQKSSWVTDNALYALAIEKHKVNLDFLIYYLAFINLNKFKKESGQPLMTQTIVYSTGCPLPPLPEQQTIAEILGAVDKRLEALRNRKEKLEKIKKGLMNDLLTGKKRVRLEA